MFRTAKTPTNTPALSSPEQRATGHLNSSDERLSRSEAHTLGVIAAWIRRFSLPPSLREIAEMRGFSHEAARLHVASLVAKRYLARGSKFASRVLQLRRDYAVIRLEGMP